MNNFFIKTTDKEEFQKIKSITGVLNIGRIIGNSVETSVNYAGQHKSTTNYYYLGSTDADSKAKVFTSYEELKNSITELPQFAIRVKDYTEAKSVLKHLSSFFKIDTQWNDYILDHHGKNAEELWLHSNKDLISLYTHDCFGQVKIYRTFEEWLSKYYKNLEDLIHSKAVESGIIKPKKGFDTSKEDMFISAGIYYRDLLNKWESFSFNYKNVCKNDTDVASTLFNNFTKEELAICLTNNIRVDGK